MDEDTARIPLRNRAHEIVAYALVDVADEDWVNQRGRWSLKADGYVIRSEHSKGSAATRTHTAIRLHRFLLGLDKGDPREGDHINHNRLDNRRSNLRILTLAENRQNVPGRSGASLFRGVYWEKRQRKWIANATVGGKAYHLGTFTDEREAAEVARQWRLANMPGAVD